ncbi:MAG: hypothetical protein EOP04_30305, partial [Proteobacteria bacterium]
MNKLLRLWFSKFFSKLTKPTFWFATNVGSILLGVCLTPSIEAYKTRKKQVAIVKELSCALVILDEGTKRKKDSDPNYYRHLQKLIGETYFRVSTAHDFVDSVDAAYWEDFTKNKTKAAQEANQLFDSSGLGDVREGLKKLRDQIMIMRGKEGNWFDNASNELQPQEKILRSYFDLRITWLLLSLNKNTQDE